MATLGALVLGSALPAEAAKKRRKADSEQQADQERPAEEDAKKSDPGAAQAEDKERPKPVLERNDAPKPDAQGRVSFGGKAGRAKILVKAPAKEKVQVFLEGRYFGIAPQTISKVPPGDYIIEAIYPDGKTVTRPVSVVGDEESVVQIGAADAVEAGGVKAEGRMSDVDAERRWRLAKFVLIGAASVAVLGAVFGGWELMVQRQYNDRIDHPLPDPIQQQTEIDDLERKGNRLALATNACLLVGAVGAVTAMVIGYPAYKARKSRRESGESPPNLSFMLAPGRSLASGSAGLVLRF